MNMMNEVSNAAPTLASSAMLIELSISTWTGRKKDKRASEEVTSTNHAASGIAAVNKKLLGDCAELVALQKFTANTRNAHYSMTMPWSDSGLRLIPTAKYFDYYQQMTALRNEYWRLVQLFLDAYDWEITQAQAKLGSLFVRDDYPTLEALKGKFNFSLNEIPLPEAGDFRVDINNEAQKEITERYNKFYTTQLERAMNDVWQRTYTALSRMSERLDYGSKEDRKIFRDSLVDNVAEMVDMLRACNITGSTQMAAMADHLEHALRGVTPDALREDAHLRRETKRAVDEAIKALPSLDM